MRHASRRGAAWADADWVWIGLRLLGTRRHFGLARWRATRREPACLAGPAAAAAAPAPASARTAYCSGRPSPTPRPRAPDLSVASSRRLIPDAVRCHSHHLVSPLARSLARVLPNRKASRKNNRQSPKEIGREREKRRRDARGGEEEKAEGEKKKKKNPRPPPAAPPRAAHTDGRTDLPPERCRIQSVRRGLGAETERPTDRAPAMQPPHPEAGPEQEAVPAPVKKKRNLPGTPGLCSPARPRLLWGWCACVRTTAAATSAPARVRALTVCLIA